MLTNNKGKNKLPWWKEHARHFVSRAAHTFRPATRPDTSDYAAEPPAYTDGPETDGNPGTEDEDTPNLDTLEDYRWRPIDAQKEIRILNLQPATSERAPIECTLTTHPRESTPGYEAISYTWVSTVCTRSITCEGSALRVTANREAALKALRPLRHTESLESSARPVWIDAICINQQNLYERSAQVAQMGEIYRLAGSTIIYLGNEDKDSTFLHSMAQDYMQESTQRSYYGESITRKTGAPEFREERQLQSLRSVSARPWFTRTWIIQEVMLSRSLHVLIGRHTYPWSVFVNLQSLLTGAHGYSLPTVVRMYWQFAHEYGKRSRPGDAYMGELKPPSMDGTTGYIERADNGSHFDLAYWRLCDLLRQTGHFQCRDPRDKLFALVPLFEPPIPALLCPDYTKTVAEVYIDLSWFLLEYDVYQGLEWAEHYQSEVLPSWVIDWRQTAMAQPLSEGFNREGWRAGYKTDARYIRAQRDELVIILRGLNLLVVGEEIGLASAFSHFMCDRSEHPPSCLLQPQYPGEVLRTGWATYINTDRPRPGPAARGPHLRTSRIFDTLRTTTGRRRL